MEQMSLDDLLNEEIVANNDSLVTVASSEIKVVKETVSLEEAKANTSKTCRDVALEKMKEYEEVSNKKAKIDVEITDIEAEIRKACPELYEKLDKLNEQSAKEAGRLKEIASEATPFFAQAVKEDEDNKTLLYGKIQATYVYPTDKHQFDLKLFIEEQNEFYTEHLSVLDPYSTITSVSDYVKFTVKKK